ncbi:MAG: type II toxin-antitoxin system RelE/ParE family toxin [Armatimonadetes bacterium]|nr:type II toxin-antitoxin system RelE/ParE family toxin [Armatimonadota bacterium]
MSQNNDESRRYAIRIQPRAERDIEAHTVRMAELAGPDTARAWYEAIFDVVATLAQNPRRYAIVRENNRFRREVRQLLYRRTPQGPAWRILYTVDEGTEDGPTVHLLHVRHGAQRPITQAEAREIEADR